MKNFIQKFAFSFLLVLVIIGFGGCGDNSVNSDKVDIANKITKEEKKKAEKFCKKNKSRFEEVRKEILQEISDRVKKSNISVNKDNIEWITVKYDELGFEFELPKNLDKHVVCKKAVAEEIMCHFDHIAYLEIHDRKKQGISSIDDFFKKMYESDNLIEEPLLSWFPFRKISKDNYEVYLAELCDKENVAVISFTNDYVIIPSKLDFLLDELGLDDNSYYKILGSFREIK